MCVPNTEVMSVDDYVAFMLFCVPLKVEQVLVVIHLEKKKSGSIWWGGGQDFWVPSSFSTW